MRYQGFIGGSYESESYIADQERSINWFVEDVLSDGGTSQRILLPTPGVSTLGNASSGAGLAHFAENGQEWAVIGQSFGSISSIGAFTALGTVATNSNPATISSNGDGGSELFITSGGNGYLYDTSTSTFSTIAALSGIATMGAQLDGYFLALDQNTSTVYISDLLDGTTWTTGTQFFQRSIAPDPWISMVTANRYIYLLGEETSEVWYNAGVSPVPFEAHPSGLIPYGCAAAFTATVDQGLVAWLGRTKHGAGMVVSTSGFAPEIISNYAIQNQIQTAGVAGATAESYEDRGHRFFLINVPQANITYAYDFSTGRWHERGYWNTATAAWETWRPRWHAYTFDEHRWLDAQATAIYRSDSSLGTDVGGVPIRRLRRAPMLQFENQRIFYSSFELLMDVGVGLVTGQGSDPQVMLRYSDDGGKTWGTEQWRTAGAQGTYGTQVRWERQGMARKRVWEVTVSDPVPYRLVDAVITTGQRPQRISQVQAAQWY